MREIESAFGILREKVEKYKIKSVSGRKGEKGVEVNKDQVKEYIALVGDQSLKIETGFFPIKIAGSLYIDAAQIGYRYIYSNNSLVVNDRWPETDLVIVDGEGGGRPIFFKVGSGEIYAMPEPALGYKMAENLPKFIFALAELIEIVYGEFGVFNVSNEDDEIDPLFIAALHKKVLPLLGTENFENFVDYFYG
ncbi:hypothetical protein HZU75_06960 [Chitinibacter fontanus]|uniref:SMI1/KNR4 family protein n=1 Tax=Chitinibacter fontanus TaxID=1737446 RepID=A0A7D5Z5B8_9NEIS|nr:hypothetical protein [Chitinibacter fontanus]QLI81283.1 hypothetical protein HZU75_06960 [Chitinibacter fontanus]